MRVSEPRIAPLPADKWDATAKEQMGRFEGEPFNIFKTMANHSELMKRWMVFANHVLVKSTLPPREREILILRIGWLCRAEYEWSQHVLIGKAVGLTEDEIDRISQGPDAPGWSEDDAALVRATDELHRDAFISDATWTVLARKWSVQQLMDVVFAVGQYNLVSMALNTLGVQLDEGLPRAKGMK